VYLNISRLFFSVIEMNELDLAIIGAGPAGITAAIYAKRKNLSVRLFEKGIAGGYVADSVLLENYTGFKEIKGIELAQKMAEHAKAQGIKIEEGITVEHAKKSTQGFELELSTGEKINAKAIIIATGTTHKQLNVPGEKELLGKGVTYCATCDGPMFREKTVAVIGGGNSGITNALFLADICKKVFIIEFGSQIKADAVYLDQLQKKKNIEVLTNRKIVRIFGDTMVEGIEVENTQTGESSMIECQGVFVYIGLLPQNSIARELGCKLDKKGYIETSKEGRTTVKGVFAAGDVSGAFAQAIVAAGTGAIAAESVFQFLLEKKN